MRSLQIDVLPDILMEFDCQQTSFNPPTEFLNSYKT